MGFLDKLNWRYAVKKFNGEKITTENLEKILEAIRMAPSASGLQPYHILVIEDQALREKLFEHAKGNPKILNCSHLFIFCSRVDFPKRVEDFITEVKQTRNQTDEDVALYHESLLKGVGAKSPEELRVWAGKQTYLALGFGLAAAAELTIDAGPMEGFKKEEFKKVLELPEYMNPEALMAVGYRDPSDENQPTLRKKVRFTSEELFEFR
jgi:nitroreductase/dihydropteridine reductase